MLPARIDYPGAKDVWIPRVFTDRDRQARAQTYYRVIGRLKPGVNVAQARDEMHGIAERLLERGEHGSKLMFAITRRLREVHAAAAMLEAGVPEQKVGEALGVPRWAVKKTLAAAKKADRVSLEHAICEFAELEVELRGGGSGGFDEDTLFSLALTRAAAA